MNAPIKYLKAGMDTSKGVQRRNSKKGKGGRTNLNGGNTVWGRLEGAAGLQPMGRVFQSWEAPNQ